jgi:hypothetical protein
MPTESHRGLGVRSAPSLEPSEWRLLVHLRTGWLLSPRPYTAIAYLYAHIAPCNRNAEGTKVNVGGLVKATDKNAKNSVTFAVVRPIRIYEGGWTRGYVLRRYLVSLCVLEGSKSKLCKNYGIIRLYTSGHCKRFRAIRETKRFGG